MGALDLCAWCEEVAEDLAIWDRFNLDTGAAVTVFPEGQAGLVRRGKAAGDRSYRTASGEVVTDKGEGAIEARGEDDLLRRLRGRLAPVHKPLVAASAVCQQGNYV
eukprot:7927191-Lingulodinium_polyedra.AAC.1